METINSSIGPSDRTPGNGEWDRKQDPRLAPLIPVPSNPSPLRIAFLRCLLPNLVLHAIQVYLVPFALDLCKHSHIHCASDPGDCGLDPWRVYHDVAASLHRSPRGGSERLEETVNGVRDSRPIFSNCHFSFT